MSEPRTPPDRIWLQVGEDGYEPNAEGVTWCEDCTDSHDEGYVRRAALLADAPDVARALQDASWLADEPCERVRSVIESQQARIKALEEEIAKLKTFRDYFSDKGEGLFFQFGMEGVARYNATHGHEAIYIAPDRRDHPKEGT